MKDCEKCRFSLPHLCNFCSKCWENVLFEFGSERVKTLIALADADSSYKRTSMGEGGIYITSIAPTDGDVSTELDRTRCVSRRI